MRRWVAALALTLAPVLPAWADGLGDWNAAPLSRDWGDWTASLGGLAGASAYAPSGPGQPDGPGANLSAVLFPHLERSLDNGWEIGLRGAILAYHDRLAGDIYGDRTFEKAYLFAQTPFGRIELGENDGAAYRLSATGPSVDDAVTVDDAGTTFFRDPLTGRAVIDAFRLQTSERASSNDAKLTYLSPQWFGLQLGVSYAPYDAHGGLPFITRGTESADRPTNIVEGAANYSGYAGDLSYGLYAGLTLDQDAMRTAGHGDLVDWGLGGEADYSLQGVKLAFGGGFRQSNAYAFDIADTRSSGETRAWRLSTTLTTGPWIAGLEYAGGKADNAAPRLALGERGLEASLGYVVNSNLQLTLGWQRLQFRRDTGTFFDSTTGLDLNAAFLHLRFHV